MVEVKQKTNMKIMDNCNLKLTPDPGDGGVAGARL